MDSECDTNANRHHPHKHNDEKMPEVMFINDYAVFMGYLSMAVKGTGILVLTWSTVVLLGGFVTLLAAEDFWSLTVITLVQTRIFDVFLKGNISNIWYSFASLREAALSVALPRKAEHRLCSRTGMVLLLVFTILLCPLFALYMFGLFVSPWISLRRLCITIGGQDYRDMLREKANLKPALLVLYSLALLQGVLFYYWAISASVEKRLVKRVAEAYELEEKDEARKSISDYLREMRAECEKDPSFARDRNLITYTVELMESNSPAKYLTGARILDTLIRRLSASQASSSDNAGSCVRFTVDSLPESAVVESQRTLMSSMVGPASSSTTIKKLVGMLDSKNQHDGGEIRLRAMRIVAYFARDIRLHKIMNSIRSICSLLQHEGEDSQAYFTGMKILSDLAEDRENFKLMSNTDDITNNIVTAIVNSNKLHETQHDEWLSIALPGLQLITRFVSAGSKSNNMKHLSEILVHNNGIGILEAMLDCSECKGHDNMQKSVILVLTQMISMSKDLSVEHRKYDELKRKFIKSLVVMFLHDSGKKSFKELAGESLAQLSRTSETSAKSILSESGIVDDLAARLRNRGKYRRIAAEILEHLCRHCNKDDNNFVKLKDAMVRDIPEVVKELLHPLAQPNPGDESLASLCGTVHEKLTSQFPDLVADFEKKATEICQEMSKVPAVPFTNLLKEAKQALEDKKKWLSCSISSPYYYHGPIPYYYHHHGSTPSYYFYDEESPNACCIS